MQNQTTIAAIATPPGRGGVGVIRLSGPKAYAIAQAISQKNLPKARMAGFRQFYDAQGEVMDEGLVLCFPNPNSFTGEDVAEIQSHGGAFFGECRPLCGQPVDCVLDGLLVFLCHGHEAE